MKIYIPPKITRVKLDPQQAISATCRANLPAWGTNYLGWRCKYTTTAVPTTTTCTLTNKLGPTTRVINGTVVAEASPS